MKFLKKNFKLIIAFTVWGVLVSGLTVYATTYLASNITYTRVGKNINNVEEALNDLYNQNKDINQTTATASDILSGKKAYTLSGLITGNLVNPTSYSTTD